jgi:ParB family chromosome partitioning protein
MKAPTLLTLSRVPVAEVVVRDRLRPVGEAGVASLLASIAETGVMKDAIHVRKKKDGQLYLIAGGHRLEAARRLGWEEIEAKVWTDVTDDWARLMEIDDNLAGAEMDALDTAVFLARRKEVYERMHPEAKAKRGAALAAARWNAADIMSVASFAKSTAEKFGMTDRHVRRLIAAGSTLHAGNIAQLRTAPRPVTLADLMEIAKIGEPSERDTVVLRLAGGNAKSAAEARRTLKVEELGVQPTLKDPVEDAFKAMVKLWSRAPKEAKRRFVHTMADELAALEGYGS